jgi:hypothetical protein
MDSPDTEYNTEHTNPYHQGNSENRGSEHRETQTPGPEKAIQDLFQWFGKVATDFTNVESLDVFSKNVYSKVGGLLLQGQNSLKMTAQEIRSKTSDELYQNIKVNILLYRDICKYAHKTNCVSVPILDEVKNRLVEEGFEVNYVIGEGTTHMNIQW